jgi:hypothetical protein
VEWHTGSAQGKNRRETTRDDGTIRENTAGFKRAPVSMMLHPDLIRKNFVNSKETWFMDLQHWTSGDNG